MAVGEELGESDAGVGDAAAGQQGRDDLAAHRAQFVQRSVAVGADAEVHLGDRLQSELVVGVDQDPDLHPVAGGERHRGEQLPGAGVLTAQRLQDRAQFRAQGGQQWSGDQFGDPAAAVGVLPVAEFRVGGGRSRGPDGCRRR